MKFQMRITTADCCLGNQIVSFLLFNPEYDVCCRLNLSMHTFYASCRYTPVRSDSIIGELRLSEPSDVVLPGIILTLLFHKGCYDNSSYNMIFFTWPNLFWNHDPAT